MNKDLIIEHYLSQLDRELQALPTGQRAEIITEIRSHILDRTAADPTKNIQTILNDMGAPRDVAARYLEQKGIKPWTPSPARNFIKWTAISVAAIFAFMIFATFASIWYFSPLIKVDEKEGRVQILGGMIDVKDMDMHISTSTHEEGEGQGYSIRLTDGGSKSEGEEDLASKAVHLIRIPFNTAKVEVSSSSEKKFKWECKNTGSNPPPLSVAAGVLTFDLNKVNMAKCDVTVPEAVKLELNGVNGALEVDEPLSDLDIKVTNGKVTIKPDSSKVYDFEVKVLNGSHDNFARSENKQALKVKVDVVNGVVRKE